MSFAPPRAQELPFQTQRTPFAPETAPQLRTFLHPPTPSTSPPEPPGPETAFSGPKHVFRPTSGPKTAFSGPKNALRPTSGPRTAFSGPKNTFRPTAGPETAFSGPKNAFSPRNLPPTANLSSPPTPRATHATSPPAPPGPEAAFSGPKHVFRPCTGQKTAYSGPKNRPSPHRRPRNRHFGPKTHLSPLRGPKNCLFWPRGRSGVLGCRERLSSFWGTENQQMMLQAVTFFVFACCWHCIHYAAAERLHFLPPLGSTMVSVHRIYLCK